jgi:hypothetical protein
MSLLSLSDVELEQVMAYAEPIDRRRRDAFLKEVAAELAHYSELGPGIVGRVCAGVQRRHFDPPILHAGPQLQPKARREAR